MPRRYFNNEQINRVSEIYMGVGHIAFASVVIPAVIDKTNIILLVLGLVIAILSWGFSISILRKIW